MNKDELGIMDVFDECIQSTVKYELYEIPMSKFLPYMLRYHQIWNAINRINKKIDELEK